MIIRNEQIQSFRKARLNDFEKRVIDHLKRKYLDIFWNTSYEKMNQFVHSAVTQAIDYGFKTEAHIVAFIELSLEYEESFDYNPIGVLRIIENPALSPEGKIHALRVLLDR